MTGAGLPDGWSLPRLDQIARVTSGKRLPKGQSVTALPTPHPYIRVTDMRMGKVDLSNIHYVPEDVAPKIARYTVDAGDLYISCAGTLGIVGLVPDVLSGANLTENANRISGIQINPHYLLHVLMSETIQGHIQNIQTVGAQPKLALGRIRSFAIPCPDDPKEQEAIAEALSDADALIEGLERLIAKKRLIKQGAMQDLLTAKRRLPGFSVEWVTFNVGEFLNFKNGLNKAKAFFGHGTPIVNYMDVFGGGRIDAASIAGLVDVTSTEKSAYGVKDGDILFTRTSETPEEIGLAAVADGVTDGTVFSGFVLRGRPQNDRLTRAYSGYCFRSEPVRQQIISRATYTTRALTNGRQLSQVEVFAPEDTQEQNAIAAVLQDMDAEVQALKARLKKARQVKEGMMQNLLTGRIRLV